MIITAWILFVFFGSFGLWTTIQYYIAKRTLGMTHSIMWFFSIVVTAITAGIIWGGLLSNTI